jgi:hypothetical protein
MYSVVIPYLSSSKYIDICKYYLQKNSLLKYELIEIVDETDVYYAYNHGVYQSKYDTVILINDDMIVSHGWDVLFYKYTTLDMVTTGYVVEPNPGVNYRPNNKIISNIKFNCGQTLTEFDYNKFDSYVKNTNVPEVLFNETGWYMPIGFNKKSFVSYPNREKYPLPNDSLLIDYVLPNLGYKFAKIRSFVYHFQNRSLLEK